MGDICEAKWSEDNNWYAAKIEKIKKDGTYFVTFTEYGNTQFCTLEEMRTSKGMSYVLCWLGFKRLF